MRERTIRIIVLGGDGYCGWPSALRFAATGHSVTIVDNLIRRRWDQELGIATLTPIRSMAERLDAWHAGGGNHVDFVDCDVTDFRALRDVFAHVRPDTIVHFAQQRSAPFSMIDRDHAAQTVTNNTMGNLNVLWAMREVAPEAHLVKLGTMGEYGTPNIEIEEGFITIEHKGRLDRLPFPKAPNSFYHLSKVADSDQIYFACRAWGLRATDLNQGVVYGLETSETPADSALVNRFDYDGVFGTVLNRFCVEAALGCPLTVYGVGGQTRAFLNIRDTVQCVAIAVESPPAPGEFRVFNQFTEIFSVLELAKRVQRVAGGAGLAVTIDHLDNPRNEREAHYYSSVNAQLLSLGLEPHCLDDATIASLIEAAAANCGRVDLAQIAPTVRWGDAQREPARTKAPRRARSASVGRS
jgi:UDP-sulfoquinovose synthase